MSELSSVYSEYEQVSNMFRQLNEASLIVRQAMLGVGTPSDEELRLARDQLEEAGTMEKTKIRMKVLPSLNCSNRRLTRMKSLQSRTYQTFAGG
jgi:hypothetical protein